MKNLLTTLLVCIVISGCAQIGPYRTGQISSSKQLCVEQNRPSETSPSECGSDAYFLVPDPKFPNSRDHHIPIGIIEFDDQGTLQNRKFKDEILDRIRVLTQTQGTLTVVFAHGWLNNAAPENQNLSNFQALLQKIAKGDREAGNTRKVVGVFLAWRGLSATIPLFREASFWNRKDRAEHVGQHGATEVLTDLGKIKAGGRNNNSRLILIGHSFGGALIYSATQQLLMKDAAYQSIKKSTGKPSSVPRTVGDLVILVNPAFEAARFTALHDKAAGMNFPEKQSPILAIFTSKTDLATKWAFPIGRYLSSIFNKYNTDIYPEQPDLDRTTVGHYTDYQTHELSLKSESKTQTSQVDAGCGWKKFREDPREQSWHVEDVILKRKELPKKLELMRNRQMNPYYNVIVDDEIISGHSGIWEPEFFMKFLYEFVRVQDTNPCRNAGSASG